MTQQRADLDGVTVWLRREHSTPPSYSARFRVEQGRGWFKWPSSSSAGIPLASGTGTAGGLNLDDISGLILRHRRSGGLSWEDVRVLPRGLPTSVDRQAGQWVEVPLGADGVEEEPTDVQPAPQPLGDTTDSLPRPALVVELDELPEDALEPADSVLGPSTLAAPGGSALVRSLVARIRQQEAELVALKRRVAELESP